MEFTSGVDDDSRLTRASVGIHCDNSNLYLGRLTLVGTRRPSICLGISLSATPCLVLDACTDISLWQVDVLIHK